MILEQWDVVCLVLFLEPARADRADDSAMGDLVEGGQAFRQDGWVVEARVEHCPGQSRVTGDRSDGGHEDE